MYDEINNLPADDPLRASTGNAADANSDHAAVATNAVPASVPPPRATGSTKTSRILGLLPAKVLAAFNANGGTTSAMPDAAPGSSSALRAPELRHRCSRAPMALWWWMPAHAWPCRRSPAPRCARWWRRRRSSACGLSGGQRSGARAGTAAGTMVPLGTEVVVRFSR